MREVLAAYLGLRLLARLLRAEDPRRAGEELDRDLDGAVRRLWGWVRALGGCLLACLLLVLALGIVGGALELLSACLHGLLGH